MRPIRTRLVGAALIAAVVVGSTVALPARPAAAAGVTTHSWMALEAIDRVADPDLRALLQANREVVRRGGHFPDSGYVGSNQFGEEAHWQRFTDAYLEQIRRRTDCGDLTAPTGPCVPAIAHLFGSMAHGMGDEVWDWLFEPNSPDLNEYYTPPELGSFVGTGGQELQMDLVALADFGQSSAPFVAVPSKPDILAAFGAVNFTAVDNAALDLGSRGIEIALAAETHWAPLHIAALHEAMPWMSHNMKSAPGGVDFAAIAIAGQWEASWGRLLGDQPDTSVSVTYPADGQRRIPASGWVRGYIPGSNPGSGGARTRITAVLTYSRPYLPLATSGGSIPALLPTGSLRLTERDTGTELPVLAGFPKSVPYTANPGHHLVDIQPATDLAPCTWYAVEVTGNLLDARSQAVTPYSWEFRTGADGAGSRCADDPYTADENYVRAVTTQLLGRDATETALRAATYNLDRGTERRAVLADLAATPELEARVVDQIYQAYLGRPADAATMAAWAAVYDDVSVPVIQALVLGSVEVYQAAGRSPAGFVDALYPKTLGRAPTAAERSAGLTRLRSGTSRPALAYELLTSSEATNFSVALAYQVLLDRAPDAAEREQWTDVLGATQSPVALWVGIMETDEYEQRAASGE